MCTGSQVCEMTMYFLCQNEMEVIIKTLQDYKNVWEIDSGGFYLDIHTF